jgi:hypothetical protein
MRSRQLLLIVPLAALLGVGAAMALYLMVDRSHSQLSAFQVQLAKQNAARSVANHNPTSSAAQRRLAALREQRRIRRERRAVRAARAAASSAAVRTAAPVGRDSSVSSNLTPPASSPTPAPVYQAPAATPRAAPKTNPAPRKSAGGGGGSFDDSG